MMESNITKENTHENETTENKSVESGVVPIEEEVTLEEVKDLAESEKTNFQNETVQEIAELNTVGLSDDVFDRLKNESGIEEQLNTLDKEAVEIAGTIQNEKEENTEELSYEQINQTWNETAKEKFGIDNFDLKKFERPTFDNDALNEALGKGKNWEEIYQEIDTYVTGSNWDQAQKAFDAMQEIDSMSPGSVKRLNEEYGILNFQRYPKEMLLAQLEDIDSTKDSGMLIFASADHNGAFDAQKDIWEKVYEQKKLSSNMRIVECESNISMVKQMIKMKNDTHKEISFLVLSAHGDKEGFALNSEDSLNEKFSKSLIDDTQSDLSHLISDDAYIIANACSSGAVDGWAQSLSKKAGIKTVGPDNLAPIIDVSIVNNTIVPTYADMNDYSEYYKGFPMTKKSK